MARVRSPEKRTVILQAAVHEIAKAGLAHLRRRAGVAAGTLFVYFANKEELLNELYLEPKSEADKRINADFPHKGTLERRARHLWSSYLDWALESGATVGARSRFSDAIREVGSMPRGVMPYAVDFQAAERLWNLSEQLTSRNHRHMPASS